MRLSTIKLFHGVASILIRGLAAPRFVCMFTLDMFLPLKNYFIVTT